MILSVKQLFKKVFFLLTDTTLSHERAVFRYNMSQIVLDLCKFQHRIAFTVLATTNQCTTRRFEHQL